MSGLSIQALKNALAAQLVANIDRKITVRPYRDPPATKPCITMDIADITYFGTFGATGLARLDLEVKLWIHAADKDSEDVAMSDYLSGGTGNDSSIFDAINLRDSSGNRSLGGLVDECVCLEVQRPFEDDDDFVAVFPVQIHCRKVGAAA